MVDELSRYLTTSAPRDIQELLPPGLHYLGRVFPVLRAVPSFDTLPVPEHEIVEPIELRKKALFWAGQSGAPLGDLTRFQRHVDVILGLNLKEASEVSTVDGADLLGWQPRQYSLSSRATPWGHVGDGAGLVTSSY